ncbi:5-oxoprolinase subunit C family protein [Marinobacter halotolerans]|uniref:5-oxoprolinase subunit C family protein n=1 Tax=Marinobacter halotolerans TaxID=1569211 RepID=UPI001CDA12C1|nr:biotin-dependent carboxyltransferase family protein [Marinobacter halotolerans]
MSPSAPALRVIRPGASATVQDTGRYGYRQHGLAVGGALDLHAFNWANSLLDNPPGAACLEIMLGGFQARAETDITVALTGAHAHIELNGSAISQWRTIALKAGDELSIGHSDCGRILYLALPGGLNSPEWFGSQSVVPREKIEGIDPISADMYLIANRNIGTTAHREVPEAFRPNYREELTLRLIPGYQFNQFSRDDLLRLTTEEYELTQQSDRMGFRLSGKPMKEVPPGIISEGIALGAVQIPGDGQPIVLLNDCQTIGGYPKPGVIASLDCHRLAQRLPGQTIRFAYTDLADAQNERRLFNSFFRERVSFENFEKGM